MRRHRGAADLRERMFAAFDGFVEGKVKASEVRAYCDLCHAIVETFKAELIETRMIGEMMNVVPGELSEPAIRALLSECNSDVSS